MIILLVYVVSFVSFSFRLLLFSVFFDPDPKRIAKRRSVQETTGNKRLHCEDSREREREREREKEEEGEERRPACRRRP